MSNYKEMYFTLFSAVEDAINILISAQQKSEDIYSSEIPFVPLETKEESQSKENRNISICIDSDEQKP